jgi:hypothetical protein
LRTNTINSNPSLDCYMCSADLQSPNKPHSRIGLSFHAANEKICQAPCEPCGIKWIESFKHCAWCGDPIDGNIITKYAIPIPALQTLLTNEQAPNKRASWTVDDANRHTAITIAMQTPEDTQNFLQTLKMGIFPEPAGRLNLLADQILRNDYLSLKEFRLNIQIQAQFRPECQLALDQAERHPQEIAALEQLILQAPHRMLAEDLNKLIGKIQKHGELSNTLHDIRRYNQTLKHPEDIAVVTQAFQEVQKTEHWTVEDANRHTAIVVALQTPTDTQNFLQTLKMGIFPEPAGRLNVLAEQILINDYSSVANFRSNIQKHAQLRPEYQLALEQTEPHPQEMAALEQLIVQAPHRMQEEDLKKLIGRMQKHSEFSSTMHDIRTYNPMLKHPDDLAIIRKIFQEIQKPENWTVEDASRHTAMTIALQTPTDTQNFLQTLKMGTFPEPARRLNLLADNILRNDYSCLADLKKNLQKFEQVSPKPPQALAEAEKYPQEMAAIEQLILQAPHRMLEEDLSTLIRKIQKHGELSNTMYDIHKYNPTLKHPEDLAKVQQTFDLAHGLPTKTASKHVTLEKT